MENLDEDPNKTLFPSRQVVRLIPSCFVFATPVPCAEAKVGPGLSYPISSCLIKKSGYPIFRPTTEVYPISSYLEIGFSLLMSCDRCPLWPYLISEYFTRKRVSARRVCGVRNAPAVSSFLCFHKIHAIGRCMSLDQPIRDLRVYNVRDCDDQPRYLRCGGCALLFFQILPKLVQWVLRAVMAFFSLHCRGHASWDSFPSRRKESVRKLCVRKLIDHHDLREVAVCEILRTRPRWFTLNATASEEEPCVRLRDGTYIPG